MRLHTTLFWLLLFVVSPPVYSDDGFTVATDKAINPDVLFERFTSKSGLPDERIRAFYQDSKGFLWIGTMNGLSRYDGYSFRNYFRNQEKNSISGNWTYAICEDAGHSLWIGTKDGLSRFDPKTETFTNFRNNPADPTSLFCNQINTMLFDSQGKLWIGTPKGVTVFDPDSRSFRRLKQYPFNTPIGKMIRSAGDYIWIATAEGPVRYDVRNGKSTFHRLTVRPNPYGDRFWSLLEDNRHLYIGTGGDGLLRLTYNAERGTYEGFESLNQVTESGQSLHRTEIFDICKADATSFWLGTDRGIVRLEKPGTPAARLRFYKHNPINEKSISNDLVYKVFIDRTNVLWCGTEIGLNKLDLHLLPFHYYTFASQQASDQVRSILSADDVTIWLGTAQSGLYRYHLADGTTQRYRFRPEPSFLNYHRSLLMDADRNLWVGTLGGATRLAAGSYTRSETMLDGAAVFSIFQDSRKTLWVGTNNGLYKLGADGSKTHFPFGGRNPGEATSEFVRSLYEDHTGAIWVGFENRGLCRFDPKTGAFTPIGGSRANERLAGGTVYSILEMPRNVIWVGTESGLNKITLSDDATRRVPMRIKTYREVDGLPDQSVNGILADRQGFLWISTIKGLARFDSRREQFQVFLPMLNFTHSCLNQLNGKLLFGASDGFVIFDPAEIRTDKRMPAVVLSDLKLFNKGVGIGQVVNGDTILRQSLATSPEIVLNYRNNGFTIGFTGLHFANPDENAYAYRMDGFDADWIPTDAQNRTATYTNLDPGTYRFEVKASNSSGRWNPHAASITVTILPPPWKTWWAITLYVLLFNALLFIFIRYLLIQSKQRQQIRFEQLEKEQLKNLNQLKLRFFTDVSHEFRTPLSLIVGPVEDLLASTDIRGVARQKIQFVQHNSQKLLQLIDELMTFQKLDQGMLKLKPERLELVTFTQDIFGNFESMAQKKGIRFQFSSGLSSVAAMVDSEKLEKVLNNLIVNALKFTPTGGAVTVQLTASSPGLVPDSDREWIRLTVEDTGKGITPDEQQYLFERYFQSESIKGGTGVGLSLTKSLVELHGGTITVDSEPNVRTCFTVLLPIDTVAAPDTLPSVQAAPKPFVYEQIVPNLTLANELVTLPLPSLATGNVASRPDLLIVDDNLDVLDYLELTFQNQYRIVKAENGRQALDRIREREPDVIISDIMMPEMDGIQLCRTLKTSLDTCHIPLILLTARSTVENQIEGIGTGADDYIPKPFHPELLRAKVENLIESRLRLLEKFRSNSVVIPKDITRNPLDEAFLQKVIDTIKANLSNEEFSVEELGDHVSMSRSNLFRKLKAITGQTPIEFIYYIRLKHAMELLLERKLNISEITYEVGFKNPSSFSKSFRKQFGKAPTEYLNDLLAAQKN
ncbi:two-component regulator propeller domain-containing protein (plasmid) [Spirosoma sp. SC4-14]|uniref:hybrid sensor histidine kinase/response regulator transcription factor n=1 Tax=Spirosoma sp. SC4-14 TaxID=3128900 RepID=UPI0030D1F6A3